MDSNFISTPKLSTSSLNKASTRIKEALPIGTRLYNYVITRAIGQGGFGITYEAKEDVSGRIVVIKENYPTSQKTQYVYRSPKDGKTVLPYEEHKDVFDLLKRIFVTEAHTLINLPYHPNIVQVLSVFETNNTVYFVMTLIKGTSLDRRYQPPATMPEPKLRLFLKDMLEILMHLHSHNIIHRDIKPENILITPKGKLVLIDFGAARPDNSQKSATQIGTGGYGAPEQMSEKEYNKYPKANLDIYALGATCYRLITGYEPDYMFDRLAKDPDIKGKYSPELLRTIDKAREKNPEDRWQSAHEWLAALNTTGSKGRKLGVLSALLLPLIAVPAAYLYYHQPSELQSPEPELPAQKPTEEQPTNVKQAQPEPEQTKQKPEQTEEERAQEQYKNIVTEAQKLIKSKQYLGLVDKLLPAAKQGYAPAQTLLGTCYEKGYGVEKDPEQAIKWYRKACEQNDAQAQCNLGKCYEKGIGVEKDPNQAIKWYRKACEQNYAEAQNHIGECYQKGIGVAKNPDLAFQWYQKATAQNHADAQCNMGWCYQKGLGVLSVPDLAVQWYRKSAAQNNATALNNLGICYLDGDGVEKNAYEALKLFRKAIEQGSATAYSNLGWCYEKGLGVERDSYQAFKYYRKAAEMDDAAGLGNLGFCYHQGIGTQKNMQQAIKCFRKAAEMDNANAQHNLAYCYQHGIGISRNREQAIYWYRKAAEQGHESAINALNNMGI